MPVFALAFGFAAGFTVVGLVCLDCILLQRRRIDALETAVSLRDEHIGHLLRRIDALQARTEQAMPPRPAAPGPFDDLLPVFNPAPARGLPGRFPLFYRN